MAGKRHRRRFLYIARSTWNLTAPLYYNLPVVELKVPAFVVASSIDGGAWGGNRNYGDSPALSLQFAMGQQQTVHRNEQVNRLSARSQMDAIQPQSASMNGDRHQPDAIG